MKIVFVRIIESFKQVLMTTDWGWKQCLIILLVGFIFVCMPIKTRENDWIINTQGFWSDIPHTYLNNQNFVYPPWGLILLLPNRWIRSEGTRMLSVSIVGWLAYGRKWSLSKFFAIILSPYFLTTMAINNMDILVVILPILLWESAKDKQWSNVIYGLSLSLLLLKPHCTILLIIYLLWKNRINWKGLSIQFAIVALLIIPISLVGSPPLLFQWLDNIMQPSQLNQYYWSINNLSLTAKLGFWIALMIVFVISIVFFLLKRNKIISWKSDQTISSLLFSSIFLMPYASMQSFITGLVFIPSWFSCFFQWAALVSGIITLSFYTKIHFWALAIVLFSLFVYSYPRRFLLINGSDEMPMT